MPARSGARSKSSINSTLVDNGLFWIGVATAAEQTTTDQTEVRSGIGLGPRQRVHLKRNLDVGLTITSLIPKTVDPTAILLEHKAPTFDHFQYYLSVLDPASQILLRQDNKAIMTSYSVNISANTPITGIFNHTIFQPDRIIRDQIEEYGSPEEVPTGLGTEITTFSDEDLPVMVNGQFFPGVTNVYIRGATELRPLNSPGGIYGYYYGKPFGIEASFTTYEKDFEENQQFFSDVSFLKDITIGPFTLTKAKMVSHSPSVSAGNYKQVTASFLATNFQYNPTT